MSDDEDAPGDAAAEGGRRGHSAGFSAPARSPAEGLLRVLDSRLAPIRRRIVGSMPRFLLAILVLISCAPATTGSAPILSGTDLGSGPAPDFTLTDGLTGAAVTLSSFRGNVVALAFLYTRCPDVCPLTAEHFRRAQQELGTDAEKVVFVAVSVDPDNDTPQNVQEFSRSHQLDRNWHFLVGQRAQLAGVWSAYGVRAVPDEGKPTVTHTDAIFLIDAKGRERVLLRTSVGAEELIKDLRILLNER